MPKPFGQMTPLPAYPLADQCRCSGTRSTKSPVWRFWVRGLECPKFLSTRRMHERMHHGCMRPSCSFLRPAVCVEVEDSFLQSFDVVRRIFCMLFAPQSMEKVVVNETLPLPSIYFPTSLSGSLQDILARTRTHAHTHTQAFWRFHSYRKCKKRGQVALAWHGVAYEQALHMGSSADRPMDTSTLFAMNDCLSKHSSLFVSACVKVVPSPGSVVHY